MSSKAMGKKQGVAPKQFIFEMLRVPEGRVGMLQAGPQYPQHNKANDVTFVTFLFRPRPALTKQVMP